MAFNIYNLRNQALNADKERELSYFSTSNFGGMVCDVYSPILISNSHISWQPSVTLPVKFIGGGCIIECTDKLDYTFTGTENLYGLEVKLNTDNASIVHDRLEDASLNSYIKFKSYKVTNLKLGENFNSLVAVTEPEGSPKANKYYYFDGVSQEYKLSNSSTVEPGVLYYQRTTNQNCTFTITQGSNSRNVAYLGNTIWLDDDTFLIPLCVKINNIVSQVISIQNKSDYEGLISLGNFNKIKNYLEQNFVWHEGGQEVVGNYKKGDIGDLNITGNIIRHQNNTETDISDTVRIPNIQIDALANDENCWNSKVIVTPEGSLRVDPHYKTPVSAGGTFAEDNWNENNPQKSAKENLGITYGTGLPQTTTATKEGDIYFKLIDEPGHIPHPIPAPWFPVYPYIRRPKYTIPPKPPIIIIDPIIRVNKAIATREEAINKITQQVKEDVEKMSQILGKDFEIKEVKKK